MKFEYTSGSKSRCATMTKEDIFYILDHQHEMKAEEIAKKIGKGVTAVRSVILKRTYHDERQQWRIANGEEI